MCVLIYNMNNTPNNATNNHSNSIINYDDDDQCDIPKFCMDYTNKNNGEFGGTNHYIMIPEEMLQPSGYANISKFTGEQGKNYSHKRIECNREPDDDCDDEYDDFDKIYGLF